jgi:hypothetical protein
MELTGSRIICILHLDANIHASHVCTINLTIVQHACQDQLHSYFIKIRKVSRHAFSHVLTALQVVAPVIPRNVLNVRKHA